MGGQNNLQYNASCITAPAPPSGEADLTVDTTEVFVDSALITSDQTED